MMNNFGHMSKLSKVIVIMIGRALIIISLSISSLASPINYLVQAKSNSTPTREDIPDFFSIPSEWVMENEYHTKLIGNDYVIRIFYNDADYDIHQVGTHYIPIITRINPINEKEELVSDENERRAITLWALRKKIGYGELDLDPWFFEQQVRTWKRQAIAFDPSQSNLNWCLGSLAGLKLVIEMAPIIIFTGGVPLAVVIIGATLKVGSGWLDALGGHLANLHTSASDNSYARMLNAINNLDVKNRAEIEETLYSEGFGGINLYLKTRLFNEVIDNVNILLEVSWALSSLANEGHQLIKYSNGRAVKINDGTELIKTLVSVGAPIVVDELIIPKDMQEASRITLLNAHLHSSVSAAMAQSVADDIRQIESATDAVELEFYINRSMLKTYLLNDNIYEMLFVYRFDLQNLRKYFGNITGKFVDEVEKDVTEWENRVENTQSLIMRISDDLDYSLSFGYPDYTSGYSKLLTSGVFPEEGSENQTFFFFAEYLSNSPNPPPDVYVLVNDVTYNMSWIETIDNGDSSYSHKYTYSISGFSPGDYQYYFNVGNTLSTDVDSFLVFNSPVEFGPTLYFRNPWNGSIIKDKVNIEVETPTGEIQYVEFFADDSLLCLDDHAPWVCPFDTSDIAFASRELTLKAIAHDRSGEQAIAQIIVLALNPFFNSPPEIRIKEPDGDVAWDRFIIRWEDEDLDDNAQISLYYDIDNSGHDGTLITRFIGEDWASDWWSWNISQFPSGSTYWIYAKIEDGVNPPEYDYGSGPVTIATLTQGENFAIDHYWLEEGEGTDNDGIPDAGENLELHVNFINESHVKWCDIEVRLINSTSGVYLIDNDALIYYINPGQIGHGNPFDFSTSDQFDGVIPFTIKLIYEDCVSGAPYQEEEVVSLAVTQNDSTTPIITSGPVVSEITPDSALISWTTNEVATGKIEYGKNDSYGQLVYDQTLTLNHTIVIRGLDPTTNYSYRVSSKDPSGNTSSYGAGTFSTINLGKGLHVEQVFLHNWEVIRSIAYKTGTNQLWVLWRDDALTFSISLYDLASGVVLSTFHIDFMSASNNSVKDLAYDGNYLWMSDSTDEVIYKFTTTGNLVQVFEWAYREPSGLAWDGSNLWVGDLDSDLICKTDNLVKPTGCFPSPGPNTSKLTWDGNFLWGIDNDTKLIYKILPTGQRVGQYPLYGFTGKGITFDGMNRLWIAFTGNAQEFFAKLEPVEDLFSPILTTNPVATSQIGSGAVINWNTDEPGTSFVRYGITASYGITVTTPLVSTIHVISLNGLIANTEYHFSACTRDLPGNEETCSPDGLFKTVSETGLNIINSIRSFDTSQSGITMANGYLWVLKADDMLYKIDPNNGDILDSVRTAEFDNPKGLAWDGSAFWIPDDDGDPAPEIFKVSPSGAIITSIPSPNDDPHAVAWDGSSLWVLDGSNRRVYHINSSSGAIISSFAIPWGKAYGLATDGSVLWIYEDEGKTINKVSISGEILVSYPSPGEDNDQHLYWDSSTNSLWLLDSRWRYQLSNNPTLAPVVAKVTANGQTNGVFRSGSNIRIEVSEQFKRSGFLANITISSLTDNPNIINAPMVDQGNGIYWFDWNTAGQMNATDYQVEVQMTDGIIGDTDGLSRNPDIQLVLAPTLSIISSYTLNAPKIQSFTWAGSNLWVTRDVPDYTSREKYSRVDLNTGNVIAECNAATDSGGVGNPQGIGWDGTYLWIGNEYSPRQITRHSTGCSIISRKAYPGINPGALTWDGTSMWIADRDTYLLYQMNSNGTILKTLPSRSNPNGIAWDGTKLWVIDRLTSLLAIDRSIGAIQDYRALGTNASALAWDGSSLWGKLPGYDVIYRLGVKPDLALAELRIDSNPVAEKQTATITATVYAHDLPASGAVLRMYHGNPDSGGTQYGPDYPLGTINPGTEKVIQIPWSAPLAGNYELYVKVDSLLVIDESNETNNSESINIAVFDPDEQPPVISNVSVVDINGDHDGFIEDIESIRINWNASDNLSGIGVNHVTINGNTYAGQGDYYVEIPPLPIGVYPFTITVNDNSDETATYWGEVNVHPHELEIISVFPSIGEGNVDTSGQIGVKFATDLNFQLVSQDALQVMASTGERIVGHLEYHPSEKMLTFIPSFGLRNNTTYTVILNSNIDLLVDVNHNTISAPVEWSFTTVADTTPPIAILKGNPIGDETLSPIEISGLYLLFGSVLDNNIDEYVIQIRNIALQSDWETIVKYNWTVDNSLLGSWDTTLYENGLYDVRLVVTDTVGYVGTATTSFVVENHNYGVFLPLIYNKTPNQFTCYPLAFTKTGEGEMPYLTPAKSSVCQQEGYYVPGETIQILGANPAVDWRINRWYGTEDDLSHTTQNTILMPFGSHRVIIEYIPAEAPMCFYLDISSSGQGSTPIASPEKSDACPLNGFYVHGEIIQLSNAIPLPGWHIDRWEGTDNDASDLSSNSVTMPSYDHTVRVVYEENPLQPGWYELGTGSAIGGGISNNQGNSYDPQLAQSNDGTIFIAWADISGGDSEIYVKRWNGSIWEEAGIGSASGGGISNNIGHSNGPALLITSDGIPYVAWKDESGGDAEIYIRRFNGTVWEEVGSGSASGGGISNNGRKSEWPTLALAPDGKVYIAWSDNSGGGDFEIYVKRWNGSAWEDVGNNSSSGGGISNDIRNSYVPVIQISSAGTPFVVWRDYNGSNEEVYIKKFNGSSWEEVGAGSASGGGISNSPYRSYDPDLVISSDGFPYVVWREDSYGDPEIYVKRWNGTTWEEVGSGSASSGGISNNSGESGEQQIAISPDGTVFIVWSDNSGGNFEIYIKRWDGFAWEELGPSSADAGGISKNNGISASPAILIMSNGYPCIAWADNTSGNYEIYILIWVQ